MNIIFTFFFNIKILIYQLLMSTSRFYNTICGMLFQLIYGIGLF